MARTSPIEEVSLPSFPCLPSSLSPFPRPVTRQNLPQSSGFLISTPRRISIRIHLSSLGVAARLGTPSQKPRPVGRGVRLSAPAPGRVSASWRGDRIARGPQGEGARPAPGNLSPTGAPGPQPTCRTRAAARPGVTASRRPRRQAGANKGARGSNAPPSHRAFGRRTACPAAGRAAPASRLGRARQAGGSGLGPGWSAFQPDVLEPPARTGVPSAPCYCPALGLSGTSPHPEEGAPSVPSRGPRAAPARKRGAATLPGRGGAEAGRPGALTADGGRRAPVPGTKDEPSGVELHPRQAC